LSVAATNAFDFLRDRRKSGEKFDLVIVDPPAFATSRSQVEGGIRGYRDLNRQAMRLLAPGGMLLTCSCSHHITASMFEDTLRQSARGLPFRMIIRQRLGAGSDHPVDLALPESEYLKATLLERVDLP
jgi:23S rRNA (cytosine1962-C5)-methyltransferase